MAAIIPPIMPRNDRPACHRLKSWLVRNTSTNAPKNKYKMLEITVSSSVRLFQILLRLTQGEVH